MHDNMKAVAPLDLDTFSLNLGRRAVRITLDRSNAASEIDPDLLEFPAKPEPVRSMAEDMSSSEIDAAIGANRDPYAEDENGIARPDDPRIRPENILLLFRICNLFKDNAALRQLSLPSRLTLVLARDEKERQVIWHQRLQLGQTLSQAAELSTSSRLEIVTFGNLGSRTEDVAKAREKFLKTVMEGPEEGAHVLAFIREPADINPALAALCDHRLSLAPIDHAMIIETMRISHSRTGALALNAILTLLPEVEGLRRLDWTLLQAAFGETNGVLVARRLAELSNRISRPENAITLNDVHGISSLRATFDQMVTDLDAWRQGRLQWSEVLASALLIGPPGTGKTLLAEALAGSAGIPFIATSYAQAQEKGHLGHYLAAMRETIDNAIAKAPCVLFFDEFDSFSRRDREHRNSEYMTSVVNALLEQLTLLNRTPGIIILAATNYPEKIDPALIRSGRFDRKLVIPLPDRAGLAGILRTHLGSHWTADLPLSSVTDQLLGCSGADAAAVARQALSLARANGEALALHHLLTAVDGIAPRLSSGLLHRIAVHEAGHVLVGAKLGQPCPERVMIGAGGGSVVARRISTVMTPKTAGELLTVLLAGRAAEAALLGSISNGAGNGPDSDLDRASEIALAMIQQWGFVDNLLWIETDRDRRHSLGHSPRQQAAALLQAAEDQATGIVRANIAPLTRIATVLLRERELDSRGIACLLNDVLHKSISEDARSDNVVIFPTAQRQR